MNLKKYLLIEKMANLQIHKNKKEVEKFLEKGFKSLT